MSAPLCCRLATTTAAKRPSHAYRISPAGCRDGVCVFVYVHVCVCACACLCVRLCVKQGMLCLCELPPNDPNACLLQEYQSSLFPAFPLWKKYGEIKKKKKSPYSIPLNCMVLCGCMLSPCTLSVFKYLMKWSAVYVRGWGDTSCLDVCLSHSPLCAELWVWSRVRKERHLITFARHEQKWRSVNLIAARYGAPAANLDTVLLNVKEVFHRWLCWKNQHVDADTATSSHWLQFPVIQKQSYFVAKQIMTTWSAKRLWNDNESKYWKYERMTLSLV